ncbi:hypothetical protein SDC9_65706 [bioreactor metagenome]|uniref:Uncharacterized protein n=1 Tax=bioreactor metagenome TaxID=1076179 RepID=A0A644XT06_9ZZZZ
MNAHAARAVYARNLKHRVVGHLRGGGVRAGHAIADVAAEGADVPQLRAADGIRGFAEHGHVFLQHRTLGCVGKARHGANAQRAVGIDGDFAQFVELIETDELRARELAFAHFNQNVAAACNQDGRRMRLHEFHGVLNARCFV